MSPRAQKSTTEQLDRILRLENSPDLWGMLGIPPGSPREVVKDAAQALVTTLHPDKRHHDPRRDDYQRATALVLAARDTILDYGSYLKHCAKHGIPLDRFPPAPEPAPDSALDLSCESFSGTLSTSVLSQDPHLHYDIEYILRKAPDVLAAPHLSLTALLSMGELDTPSAELAKRQRRATKHPRVAHLGEPLLAKAFVGDGFLLRVSNVADYFVIGPRERPDLYGSALNSMFFGGERRQLSELIEFLLWLRQENPEVLTHISDWRVGQKKEFLYTQQATKAQESQFLLLSDPRTPPEKIALVFAEIAKSSDDFNFAAEALRLIPDLPNFLRCPEGQKCLWTLANKDPNLLHAVRWRSDEELRSIGREFLLANASTLLASSKRQDNILRLCEALDIDPDHPIPLRSFDPDIQDRVMDTLKKSIALACEPRAPLSHRPLRILIDTLDVQEAITPFIKEKMRAVLSNPGRRSAPRIVTSFLESLGAMAYDPEIDVLVRTHMKKFPQVYRSGIKSGLDAAAKEAKSLGDTQARTKE